MRSFIYGWSLLLFSAFEMAASQHADCSRVRTIEPTFDPQKLADERTFQNFHNQTASSSLEWPEDMAVPVTFTLKAVDKEPDPEFRAIVQISMTNVDPMNGRFQSILEENTDAEGEAEGSPLAHSGELRRAFESRSLFNCFVDRSADNPCVEGAENPRCCYHPDARLNDLHENYPACPHGCQQFGPGDSVLKRPCQAVCSHGLVVQVEFHLNKNGTGGRTTVSAVYKQTKLLQSDDPDDYEFDRIGSSDRVPSYAEGSRLDEGSAVNGRVEMGFWLRWTPRRDLLGPFLEVGRAAEAVPYMVHNFEKHCFDCDSRDRHGWREADVQNPLLLNVFRPRYWYVNALAGRGEVEAGFDCSNIIYSPYQDQQWLDGPCILDAQCRDWCQTRSCLGRSCELDADHYGDELQWLGMKTCQIEATEEMPTYIIIILVLVVLIGIVALLLLALCLFYLGSIYPRKKRAAHTTVQAPDIHRKGEAVVLEEWEPQTLEEDQGAQAPTPFDMTGIPVTVPYTDESLLHDIRNDSIFSAFRDRNKKKQKSRAKSKEKGGTASGTGASGIPITTHRSTGTSSSKRSPRSRTQSTSGTSLAFSTTSETRPSSSVSRCNCKDTCSTRKCPCRDNKQRCNSRCHESSHSKCNNK